MASFELPMESSDSDSVPPCLCENKGISYKSQRCMEAYPLELYFFSLCCLRYLLFKSRCDENGQLETWKLFLIRS
jgi:hypothetical protein